jgi:hypothetical protein
VKTRSRRTKVCHRPGNAGLPQERVEFAARGRHGPGERCQRREVARHEVRVRTGRWWVDLVVDQNPDAMGARTDLYGMCASAGWPTGYRSLPGRSPLVTVSHRPGRRGEHPMEFSRLAYMTWLRWVTVAEPVQGDGPTIMGRHITCTFQHR